MNALCQPLYFEGRVVLFAFPWVLDHQMIPNS